jgi:predicted fused transcriptional regulator/phosphomethylpyrimidine kinase
MNRLKIKEYMESTPSVLLRHQTKTLVYEFVDIAKGYLRDLTLFTNFYSYLARKFGDNSFIARVFRTYYNKRAVGNLASLNEFINMRKSIGQKVEQLKRQTDKESEMLVNLFRRSDDLAIDEMSKITTYAKNNDPEFYVKIEKAKKVAQKLGEIEAPKNLRSREYLIAALLVSGGAVLYLNFNESEEGEVEITDEESLSIEEVIENGEEEDSETIIIHYEKSEIDKVIEELQAMTKELDGYEK